MKARELQAVLAWSSLPFVGEKTLQSLLEHAREGRLSLADLWAAPIDDLAQLVRLHPRSVAALESGAAERWTRAGEDAAQITARGVDVLLPGEPDYPAVLGDSRRWPLLFAYGAPGLLEEPRVALVSSKTVTNRGLTALEALADALARRDVALVSSIHREGYQAAALAAKRHAGPSLMVLDRGMAEAFPSGMEREPLAPARVWDTRFDTDLQLLLSPFGWRERWTARSGPRRDGLIFDLADVVVAVEIRPGGTMERECLAAIRSGKTVLALDLRAGNADHAAQVYAGATEVIPFPRSGADAAAETVLRHLPQARVDAEPTPDSEGWLREVGLFLLRACERLHGALPRDASLGAFPSAGVLARTAARYHRAGESSAGWSWLLADLRSGSMPARVGQLQERVRRGGLLAALVPAEWLQHPRFAGEREAWATHAALRLVAALPLDAAVSGGAPAAAIILERDGAPGSPVPTFAAQGERMGRFHLRRYLQEVLQALD